jgi:cell division transport system permease protein
MHILAMKLALAHLGRKKLARAMVVCSVAGLLLMTGLLVVLMQGVSGGMREIENSRTLTAFIQSEFNDEQTGTAVSAIRKAPGVSSVKLVSRDEFLKRFSSLFPAAKEEMAAADLEAVPRYVKVHVAARDEARARAHIGHIKGVESVEASTNRLAGVLKALGSLRFVVLLMVIAAVGALASVLINHFKLSTQLAQQMKRTLTSLGASRAFMLLPFAVEGAAEGLAAGVLAAIGLFALGGAFEARMNDAARALGYGAQHYELLPLALMLAGAGILLGVLGSVWAATLASD